MSITNYLTNLNRYYSKITDLVSNIEYFNDFDVENTLISDGGGDLFDGGNKLSFSSHEDFGVLLPYTHTQAGSGGEIGVNYTNPPMDGQIESAFSYDGGTNSEYFTNMYPGMFVFVGTGLDTPYFSVHGNMGSDGAEVVTSDDGNQSVFEGYLTSDGVVLNIGGQSYTMFTRFSRDESGSDPTLNHIIIVKNNSSTHQFSGSHNEDYYDQINLNSSELYFLMFATSDDPIGNSEEIATKFLQLVIGSKNSNPLPAYTFEVQAYTMQELIGLGYYGNLLSDAIRQREESVIHIIDYPLKHGDKFTRYGAEAKRIKKLFVDVENPVLKIIGTVPVIRNADVVNIIENVEKILTVHAVAEMPGDSKITYALGTEHDENNFSIDPITGIVYGPVSAGTYTIQAIAENNYGKSAKLIEINVVKNLQYLWDGGNSGTPPLYHLQTNGQLPEQQFSFSVGVRDKDGNVMDPRDIFSTGDHISFDCVDQFASDPIFATIQSLTFDGNYYNFICNEIISDLPIILYNNEDVITISKITSNVSTLLAGPFTGSTICYGTTSYPTTTSIVVPSGVVKVKLTSSVGLLSLLSTSGLSFSEGDGDADYSMTFSGTNGDINSAFSAGLTAMFDHGQGFGIILRMFNSDDLLIGAKRVLMYRRLNAPHTDRAYLYGGVGGSVNDGYVVDDGNGPANFYFSNVTEEGSDGFDWAYRSFGDGTGNDDPTLNDSLNFLNQKADSIGGVIYSSTNYGLINTFITRLAVDGVTRVGEVLIAQIYKTAIPRLAAIDNNTTPVNQPWVIAGFALAGIRGGNCSVSIHANNGAVVSASPLVGSIDDIESIVAGATITPALDFSGNVTVTISITDSAGLVSESRVFTLAVS